MCHTPARRSHQATLPRRTFLVAMMVVMMEELAVELAGWAGEMAERVVPVATQAEATARMVHKGSGTQTPLAPLQQSGSRHCPSGTLFAHHTSIHLHQANIRSCTSQSVLVRRIGTMQCSSL